jgi:hypothetical protein
MILPIRYVSIAIERKPAEVYAFAGNPTNLPLWAAGLGLGIERDGEHWKILTPDGAVRLRFAALNDWGVMDHVVELSNSEISVPFRVVANGSGSEVTLGLFRQPEMDDETYDRDAALMLADLRQLKSVLEGR